MTSFLFPLLALVFTLLVKFVDVAAIGPEGSLVGFASLNSFVHSSLGVHSLFGTLSDLLLIPAFLTVLIFCCLGVKDLLQKKSFKQVSPHFFYLLGFYFLIAILYVVFEKLALNYRPILIDGVLEPSFPSSHTLFAVTLYSSAVLNLDLLTKNPQAQKLLKRFSFLFLTLVVVFRLLSGVHWLTDILGGLVWGFALVCTLARSQPRTPAPHAKSASKSESKPEPKPKSKPAPKTA
ncbi:phosphatase PAP2 family protein [Candidatus Saccharibacteria bacterium]|nr:phosphatase PAP2 family protein [Candidatus Saccharibacteria bacterium]